MTFNDPNNQPVLVCPDCGKPMRVEWQNGLIPGRSGFWIFTCDTARGQCDYALGTFSEYPPAVVMCGGKDAQ